MTSDQNSIKFTGLFLAQNEAGKSTRIITVKIYQQKRYQNDTQTASVKYMTWDQISNNFTGLFLAENEAGKSTRIITVKIHQQKRYQNDTQTASVK